MRTYSLPVLDQLGCQSDCPAYFGENAEGLVVCGLIRANLRSIEEAPSNAAAQDESSLARLQGLDIYQIDRDEQDPLIRSVRALVDAGDIKKRMMEHFGGRMPNCSDFREQGAAVAE